MTTATESIQAVERLRQMLDVPPRPEGHDLCDVGYCSIHDALDALEELARAAGVVVREDMGIMEYPEGRDLRDALAWVKGKRRRRP